MTTPDAAAELVSGASDHPTGLSVACEETVQWSLGVSVLCIRCSVSSSNTEMELREMLRV